MVKDATDDLHAGSPTRGYRSHPRGVKHQRPAGLSTLGASPQSCRALLAHAGDGGLAKPFSPSRWPILALQRSMTRLSTGAVSPGGSRRSGRAITTPAQTCERVGTVRRVSPLIRFHLLVAIASLEN